MALWIEIRCERRGDEGFDSCLSDIDAGPIMGIFGDSISEAKAAVKLLNLEAIRYGWRRRKDGWHCPKCHAMLTAAQAQGGGDV